MPTPDGVIHSPADEGAQPWRGGVLRRPSLRLQTLAPPAIVAPMQSLFPFVLVVFAASSGAAWADDIVADAGGPYEVDAESTVLLDASGTSYDPSECDAPEFRWNLDGMHGYDTSWSIASDTIFDAAGIDGPDLVTVTVAVRTVCEGVDKNDSDTATVTVNNVPPEIFAVDGPSSAYVDELTSWTVRYLDVESADTHSIVWSWGDGESNTGAHAEHTYAVEGFYVVQVTVTDDDGDAVVAEAGIDVWPDEGTDGGAGDGGAGDGGAGDGGAGDGGAGDGGAGDGGAGDGGATDGGTVDGGTGDGGTGDGGTGDGGAADGGAGDGGAGDGGTVDGGATDGGTVDGGTTDGGTTDGGTTDGGATDGGTTDGGATDGGTTDSGAGDGGTGDGGTADGGTGDGGTGDGGTGDGGTGDGGTGDGGTADGGETSGDGGSRSSSDSGASPDGLDADFIIAGEGCSCSSIARSKAAVWLLGVPSLLGLVLLRRRPREA